VIQLLSQIDFFLILTLVPTISLMGIHTIQQLHMKQTRQLQVLEYKIIAIFLTSWDQLEVRAIAQYLKMGQSGAVDLEAQVSSSMHQFLYQPSIVELTIGLRQLGMKCNPC